MGEWLRHDKVGKKYFDELRQGGGNLGKNFFNNKGGQYLAGPTGSGSGPRGSI